MSKFELLAIVAALAPKEIADWHSPIYLISKPKRPAGKEWCDGCKGDGDCLDPENCEVLREWQAQVEAWRTDRDRYFEMSWRVAWAESVLDTASKSELMED